MPARWARIAAVGLAALVVVFYVIRVAVIEAFAARDPGKAAALWPSHPAVVLESGLAQVGERAAAGRPIDPGLVSRLIAASAQAPLAIEPFLVRGVDAQVSGNAPLALQSFLAARQRNPRSVAPRYFLADYYSKAGSTALGLGEISTLSRLVPQSIPAVMPYLAAYARAPGAAPQIKGMLQAHPAMEPVLLNELAADAANASLILDIWSGRSGDDARSWQGRLLGQLVAANRYAEARLAWARFTNISAKHDRLLDPEFSAGVLPPFGWTLASGGSGIAEPQGGGRLHVIYYGRDDLVLASQLMTLPPGSYRLSMDLDPGSPAARVLTWTVRCLPSSYVLASIPADRRGAVAAAFTVTPGNCLAQRLELSGNAPEFPQQSELTVSKLQLQRDGG